MNNDIISLTIEIYMTGVKNRAGFATVNTSMDPALSCEGSSASFYGYISSACMSCVGLLHLCHPPLPNFKLMHLKYSNYGSVQCVFHYVFNTFLLYHEK